LHGGKEGKRVGESGEAAARPPLQAGQRVTWWRRTWRMASTRWQHPEPVNHEGH
jgi:hypothetical protein